MRSKTSFFNTMLFRKTITRFWPIWFAYAFVWAICLPICLGSEIASILRYQGTQSDLINALQSLPLEMGLTVGTFISAAAGCIVAMAIFSHLYFARSAGTFATLPLRREGVFVSITLAGILPILAINVLTFAAALIVEAAFGTVYLPALLQWLALVSMLNVFFFGFASLCAQLTGNLVVLPLVYAVLNFTVFVVEYLVKYILGIFVFGFSGSAFTLDFLSPIVGIMSRCSVDGTYIHDAATQKDMITGYFFSGWGIVIGYAAVGLALIALSLLLYKRRRMETAGDVVALRCLKPVFKYCLALGCALCLGLLLFEIIFSYGNYTGTAGYVLALCAFMILGCFIGYFAAEMLMQKSFSVWRGNRRWLGFGVACVAIIALTFSCEFGLFGYENHIPAAEDIKDVSINTNGDDTMFSSPENIAAAVALHESIVENKKQHESHSGYICYTYLTYTLNDGSKISRAYDLTYDTESETGDVRTLQNLINTREAIDYRKQMTIAITAENIDYAYVNFRLPTTDEQNDGNAMSLELTADEANALYYECVIPDLNDGTLGRIWLITDEDYMNTVYAASIYIECYERNSDGEFKYQNFYTVPTVDSLRTNAWLAEHGVQLFTEGELSAQYNDYPMAEPAVPHN